MIHHARRSLLRMTHCCVAVLALLLIVAPAQGCLRCQEVEVLDTSTPLEECVDPPEFDAAGRPVPVRRPLLRGDHATNSVAAKAGPVRVSRPTISWGDCVSGYRLSNGLCAPLRC